MSKGKVLIVDDSLTTVRIVEKMLKNEGFEVIASSDGVEGLKKVYIEHPDLVILDLVLPLLDGFEVCRSLKQSEKCKDIPIIICTARRELIEGERDKIGADDYIVKPFTKKELLGKIEGVIGGTKQF